MKLLSVIIPAYNVENYIVRCLDSITSQELNKDIEIIIINDGSSDRTQYVTENYSKRYNNIFLYNQNNSGVSAARNKGFQHSTGEYIWFVDADDYIAENSLACIFDKINRHKNAELFSGRYFQDKELCGIEYNANKPYTGYEFINVRPYFYTHTFIYRRDFLAKYNLLFFDSINIEDYHFNLRVFFYAERIYHIENPIYHYIRRDGSASMTRTKEHLEKLSSASVRVMKSLKSFLDEHEHNNSKVEFYQLIYECVNGLCFSWLRFNYSYSFVRSQLNELSETGLYPSKKTKNTKSNIFALAANIRPLLMTLIFLKNLFNK